VFNLDTRVNFDKVVPALLIDQEFGSTGVSVIDCLCKLDSIRQDGLSNVFSEVRSGRDFDDLLVSSLNGTVSFK
jgi:hypothetical protein